MAVMDCKDCGGKVSDRADACPHCGCPTIEMAPWYVRPMMRAQERPKEGLFLRTLNGLTGLVLAAFWISVIWFFWFRG